MSGCDDRFQVDGSFGPMVVFEGDPLDLIDHHKCDHGEDDPCEDCEAPTEDE